MEDPFPKAAGKGLSISEDPLGQGATQDGFTSHPARLSIQDTLKLIIDIQTTQINEILSIAFPLYGLRSANWQ